MTVCIAAICNDGGYVVGACDRMLTGGDLIEYEPDQTKIIPLTRSIVVMCAGDSALQTMILDQVKQDVQTRIAADPHNWWLVRDVAFLYNRYYNIELNRRAENSVLAPLGLNNQSFIQKQQRMAVSLVNKLASEIVNFEMPDAETIFAGIDPTGAHIYAANGPNLTCRDVAGFSTIGVGSWHADSQFMFAAHSRKKFGPATALLTFSAKKRAEVAPGVGRQTDMWGMGPNLGSLYIFPPQLINDLEQIYQEGQDNTARVSKDSEDKINAYIQKLAEDEAAQDKAQAAAKPEVLPPASEDGKEVENSIIKELGI